MRAVIDIILLAIIALCTWGGYKRGLIGGIAGLLAIVIALFGGSLLSSAYSGEVIPALEPFVDGYIDSQQNREEVLDSLGYGNSDKSLNDILAEDPSLRYDYAYECMERIGLYEKRSEEMATEAVVAVLCRTITHVGGLMLAFLLILIFLIAIANVGNLSFRLPNMETLDEIGGAVLGFVKGFIYCVLLCWVLSFFGLIIGKSTMSDTVLGRFFLAFEFITKGLM